MQIPARAKFCPECGAGQSSEGAPVILVILLLGSSLLLMSSSYVTTKQISGQKSSTFTSSANAAVLAPVPPKSVNESAYLAAKEFVQKSFPNAMRISEANESPVVKDGETAVNVTMYVDALANGSPVRNVLQVKLDMAAGEWKLKEISQ